MLVHGLASGTLVIYVNYIGAYYNLRQNGPPPLCHYLHWIPQVVSLLIALHNQLPTRMLFTGCVVLDNMESHHKVDNLHLS